MKVIATLALIIGFFFSLNGQKKVMDQSAYSEWNAIRSEAISNDGQWVKYHLTPGKGDKTLVLTNASGNEESKFERVKSSTFTEDSKYLIFSIGGAQDSITAMKRRKVDKKDMPKDSLVILNLEDGSRELIPDLGSFKVPSKWSGIVTYQSHIDINHQDTTKKEKTEQRFFVDYLGGGRDTFQNVDSYVIAEKGDGIAFQRSGKDSSKMTGVFLLDISEKKLTSIITGRGEYKNLSIDEEGSQVAFIADRDTTKRRRRPYELHLWSNSRLSMLAHSGDRLTGEDHFVNENTKPSFSKDGSILYFGIGARAVLPDSLALENEMVQVEVWTTEDPMLYTMQELQKDRLEKETYQMLYQINDMKFQALESSRRKNLRKSNKGNGPFYIVSDEKAYMKSVTWMGRSPSDIYLLDANSGKETLVAKELSGSANFSPTGKYIYWFDGQNLDWYTYNVESGVVVNISKGLTESIVNELHDSPSKPRSYGSAGWMTDDEYLLIYDRFDIWRLDPAGKATAVKLSNGRSDQLQRRIIDLDVEKDELETESLVYLFNEKTKESGYGKLNIASGEVEDIMLEAYAYRRRPMKAKNAKKVVFSKESFMEFPELRVSDMTFRNDVVVSNANPQQAEYRWGSIELFEWKDFKGKTVEGLLVKPEDFDPLKKYPVIVNFYERSSSGLHRHRAPEPHRSTINYSYYANKGYIIFNPDVEYEIGEPGASAYNAVVSGVEALSKKQFIDKSRIAVQGHSWGGYQIAHLLNKTNIFKCAESGAPVVNMVSAYGGIRWGSGMSRMFQYEKTQSRLGKTLWEDRDVYLRNSPIFEMDKMNTPVLILHNDNDGAVPWYQGIEYFMALRRLGKPAWFLNYNGEPHWPLKWENRLDFNKRMEQFFAHYLLDEPMPRWMKEGVSVLNKGVNQGFEIDR